MDIAELDTVAEDDGIVVTLKDVTGEPMIATDTQQPLTLKVAGAFSDRYRAAQKRLTNKRIQATKRGAGDLDADAIEDNELALEAACIIEWPFVSGGQPFPISLTNWKALVQKQPQWQGQVWSAMHDHAGFFAPR